MKALLLAAGLGTRLQPLTDVVPKCLVPIRGVPLLEYWLRFLAENGVDSILLNLHYHADMVREYLESSPYRDLVTLSHERELLGTGGTIKANEEFFRGDDFMVIHADNYSYFDFAAFEEIYRKRPEGCELGVLLFEAPDPKQCGIVVLDQDSRIIEFHEKVENPPGVLANAAVYLCSPQILDKVVALDGPFIDLSTEVVRPLVGKMVGVQCAKVHLDIGTPRAFMTAQETPWPGTPVATHWDYDRHIQNYSEHMRRCMTEFSAE